MLEPFGLLLVVPYLAHQPRHPHSGVVRVSLVLAHGDRRLRFAAVGEQDRSRRVLPAMVVQRLVGIRTLAVFDVAVAIEVGRAFEPPERRARLLLHAPNERRARGPAPELVQDYE